MIAQIKKDWFYLTIILVLLICMGLLLFSNQVDKKTSHEIDEIEYIDSVNNYHKVFYDKTFKELKSENENLYDSLKRYKDKLDYVLQFSYTKDYSSGIVVSDMGASTQTQEAITEDSITFEYHSEPNDTFSYDLRINSSKEPNWYSLDVKTKETFTIVNKKPEGSSLNELSIESEGGGSIGEVTAFSQRKKTKFKDRISVGPTISGGYDPFSKQWGGMIGVGVTFDVRKRK